VVVREGVNGFVVNSVAEAVAAVGRLGAVDRAAVRHDCESRFSCEAVVSAYEQIYREALG
jgi:hypothetical protein